MAAEFSATRNLFHGIVLLLLYLYFSTPVQYNSQSACSLCPIITMDTTTGNSNYNHFQVVIVVDFDDARLYPLTEEIPKCLLPVANRKILGYQLDVLQSCGATEVFITTPLEYQTQLSHFLAEEYSSSIGSSAPMGIEIIPVPDMLGSADALRAVADRIRGDFIVVNSDLISQINLGVLINTHRLKTSDVTMMLSSVSIEETMEMNKKVKGGSSSGSGGGKTASAAVKPTKIEEEDQEYIGICEDGRVMIKTPALEIDDESHLTFSKPLIQKSCGSGGKLRFRCDLIDTGVYCMSFWILEFLASSKFISTIRTDLLPYLVQRQHQSTEYLLQHLPGLEHRRRGLQVLEPWLVKTRAITESFLMPPLAVNAPPLPPSNLLSCVSEGLTPALSSTSTGSGSGSGAGNVAEMSTACFLSPIVPRRQPASSIVSPSGDDDSVTQQSGTVPSQSSLLETETESEDLLRCFAVLIESPKELSPYPVICQRVTNFQSYMSLNSFFPFAAVPVQNSKSSEVCKWFCPWVPYAGSQVSASDSNVIMKKEQSLVGMGADLGDKIGDNCTIQNCIISDNAVIENGCSLKHCYVGANVRLKEGSAIKQETISSSTITE